MDWANENTLQFIKLFSKEPILWDPKNPNHKNRTLVLDAWFRIQKAMSIDCTVEILKRKKNSLLTQYRDSLRKIRNSSKTATRVEEVHQPIWFAFDALHSFLGDIYQHRPSFNTEVYLFPEPEDSEDTQYQNEKPDHWPPVRENKVEEVFFEMSSEENSESAIDQPSPLSPPSPPIKKRSRVKIDKVYSVNKRKSTKNDNKESNSSDECDIYGQLLATKLMKLNSEDRLRLMNDIDNLTYKHMMAARRHRASSSTSVS